MTPTYFDQVAEDCTQAALYYLRRRFIGQAEEQWRARRYALACAAALRKETPWKS